MRNALRLEVRKLWRYKGVYIALIFGILFMIPEVYSSYRLYEVRMFEYENVSDGSGYPAILATIWMGGNAVSVWRTLYYLILPILAVIPFAATYYGEIRTGYVKNLYAKIRKRHYIASKYTVSYISGGVVGAFPLILNLWITSLYVPNLLPTPQALDNAIINGSLWSRIFYTKPMLYAWIYIGLAFLYSGVFAVLSMTIAYLSRSIFVVYLFPFLLNASTYYMFDYDMTLIGKVPIAFLDPTQFNVRSSYGWIAGMYVCLMILSIVCVRMHERKDCLV